MMFFYFLKIIFDISTSKRSKKYKPHSILAKKKNWNSVKSRFNRRTKQPRISTGVVHHTCGDEEGKYISFKLQIKDFHSDGEVKYISFKLSSHFISTGMTMLFHRGILFLWIQAFTTVVYLINRLHSSALNSESPYFTLHETLPYYSSPPVFGSKSFPYT